jgi:FtsH-binding integral membrane protein
MFGGMSLYGYSTKKDLTSMGSFLFMGLIGLVIASLINILFRSPAIEFALSFLGVLIFTGLIAYDTQKLKSLYYQGTDTDGKIGIMAAFTLYLDFINLFIYLLRFFGEKINDKER